MKVIVVCGTVNRIPLSMPLRCFKMFWVPTNYKLYKKKDDVIKFIMSWQFVQKIIYHSGNCRTASHAIKSFHFLRFEIMISVFTLDCVEFFGKNFSRTSMSGF